ncbi:aspartyl/glutamyl-tRNA(Asn/Gln) amidotransferase subunit B [Desulfatibacillum alkenivorans DSM 16219]|jgi:aspartyl-tRNA(Asn)/glutamyl-tRNA(Gln) amidotransferase subunit B|uniref:Aspartyl/glutamyl-tRNA(Asn/Gln) amidotransferase subunit B n=1 Tax=Desulfatibacillum alkenivorans DSM 16219 TaxID=1121393 RepID=A0A1M6V485_9BACT|nr:Asp-tRNA(Asn)/Glu-tRNA(Gln) amidotransferase subunit GatB [Desulfatibacillum alkenivorans]SHK76307.1 aspartyl/glutamyl-tRNA(Asn/Gln) amidotransferase subunit B [Desulfatibacillum alkenivorans DSM 16219]
MEFEAVIGLEVHAQLKTESKIFCGCSTAFGASPNTHTCPVCLGMPGSLPVLNKKVVDYAMRMALATKCSISPYSRFARKNYFYPDLPKGYQISQYELPIAEHGHLMVDTAQGKKRIGITRIHMEEDAGKLTHDSHRPVSRVDLNRTGTPLIEIVSEPDMRSPLEASAYLKQLHAILRYLDICDGNMEEGSFRCDANVSVRPRGQEEFGVRAEIKNMNSFRNVERAIAYEIDRQSTLVEEGGEVIQETRLWDAEKSRTFSMRSKEEAHDYRYFPDPDLVPLVIDEAWIEQVRGLLPELPEERKARFLEQYGLAQDDAVFLTSAREMADYYEACVEIFHDPKQVCNWVTGALAALLNAKGVSVTESPISAKRLAALLKLIKDGVISGKIAKTVFEYMETDERDPEAIVQEKGLVQVSDSGEIESMVQEVLDACPEEVEAYRGGKKKLMGFFVGQIMKKTKGKANPQTVNQLLKEKLD